MAPDAVLLEHGCPFVGEMNSLRHFPGKEDIGIPHARDAFHGDMVGFVVIGEMAVDAFLAAVPGVMKPVFVFGFHDMATGAEIRGPRSGIQSWRPETHESHYSQAGKAKKNRHPNRSLPSSSSKHLSHGACSRYLVSLVVETRKIGKGIKNGKNSGIGAQAFAPKKLLHTTFL
jgi:hypothetical protein